MAMNRLMEIIRKKNRLVVGLMSGTSVDGIDAALVRISGSGIGSEVELLEFVNVPYSEEVRAMIFQLFDPRTGTVEKICLRNFLLGELFAEAALTVIQKAGLKAENIDLIGSHGQTIYHQPHPQTECGHTIRSTLQIGEPAVIAERTGILTIADFRVRDMAAGGQGAPLVSYADYILFREDGRTVGLQNIGGIANVTIIPPAAKMDEVWAFDNGPGNMIIDQLVRMVTDGRRSYDEGGQMARSGTVNQELLLYLMNDPYFRQLPPKTTGREYFGEHYAAEILKVDLAQKLSQADLLATVTALTARSIVQSYQEFVMPRQGLDKVILSGGGCYNKTLVQMIKEALPGIQVLTQEELGFNSDAKEAIAFALLANEVLNGNCNNIPEATGANHQVVMGKLSL